MGMILEALTAGVEGRNKASYYGFTVTNQNERVRLDAQLDLLALQPEASYKC